MTFILILVFSLGYGSFPMTVTADFTSEATCLRARNEVTSAYKRLGRENALLTANCLPK